MRIPPPQLPPGFRWIAVRPGAAPPARRRRRLLGPTPRYAVIPRWGLRDRVAQAPDAAATATQTGPSVETVRTTLFVSVLVLCLAALVYVVMYAMLVINRDTLLNSFLALAANGLGILASLAALAAVGFAGVMLIRWLIARRDAVFSHHGIPDPRSVRDLWAGCVVPFVNLVRAPVYAAELATVEENYSRLRSPIVQWWIVWAASYAVSIWAIITSFATDAQGIANNTALMVLAYLLAAATVAAAARVFEGFVRKPVERPARRWVVAGDDRPAEPVSASRVEFDGQEPAA